MEEEKKEEKITYQGVKRSLFWYWKITKKHQLWFWLLFVIYGVGIIFSDVLSVVIYKKIIDSIIAEQGLTNEIFRLSLWLAGIYVVFYGLYRWGDEVTRIFQVEAAKDLSNMVFRNIQQHSYDFFSNRQVGSISSQAGRFNSAFINIGDTLVFNYWMNGVHLAGIFVAVAFYSWELALALLFVMILTFVSMIPLMKRRMKYDAEAAERSSKAGGHFSDVISNIMTMKVFSASQKETRDFEELNEKEAESQHKSYRAFTILSAVQNGYILLLQLGMLFGGIYLWSQGKVTPGTIVLVWTYTMSLFGIAWSFTRATSHMLRSFADAQEMADLLDMAPSVKDPENPEKDRIKKGEIVFREVGFSYEGEQKVFERFSIKITAGEKLGLVGPSGGGKTTITKLLLRFIDPQAGEIVIDGQNIRNITQDDLRKAIAYVPQEPLLFHRSLRENIAYGKPEATDEEVIEAAKKAHAHEFIEKLEKGYDTMVGERGVKLSGGQRQRVAIARAILKDAPILVLDEATSALDTVSEMKIRQALDELMKEKTAIIIAHRLSTVEKLDRIIVLNNEGAIEEEGTHTTLVAKDGLYAELWRHQSGGFLDDDATETEEEA